MFATFLEHALVQHTNRHWRIRVVRFCHATIDVPNSRHIGSLPHDGPVAYGNPML